MKKINCPPFEVSYKNRKAGHFLGQAGSFVTNLAELSENYQYQLKPH